MSKISEQDAARGLDPENVPTDGGAALHTNVPVGTGLDNGGGYTLVFPPEGRIAETAKALNDAAAGREHEVVYTDSAFRVPNDIAEAADFGTDTAVVDAPGVTGTSSPTVRENGFGNYVPEGANQAAVATSGDATTGGSSAPSPAESVKRASTKTPRGGAHKAADAE